MQKNQLSVFLFLLMVSISLFSLIQIVKAETILVAYSDSTIAGGLRLTCIHPANNGATMVSGIGQIFKVATASDVYLTQINIKMSKTSSPTDGRMEIRIYENGNTNNGVPSGSEIATSTNGFWTDTGSYAWVAGYFDGTLKLTANRYYVFAVILENATFVDASNYWNVGYYANTYNDGGYMEFKYNQWYYNSGDIAFFVYGQSSATTPTPTPAPTPTPVPLSGSVGIRFMVNYNGTATNNYSAYSNITWTILQNGTPQLIYAVGNTGAFSPVTYFNDGTNIGVLPQLATGWYFWNYTILTDTGYNLTYPIDNYAFNLSSVHGLLWNITLGVSEISNTVDLTLIESSHGSIYFQNYANSVPSGNRYGANTYKINYGTVLYISTLPDSGYITDYFTVNSNGVNSIVNGSYLTLICSGNVTITAHYSISSSTNVTGGYPSILGFLSSFTWQNIAILIIYFVITGLCTWKFAFTGLIAGIDISTVVCFVTGLLGSLMYPVLGLVIIVNIALIILGAGLLNRKSNGQDA